jgi:deoxycytidylate deaminase
LLKTKIDEENVEYEVDKLLYSDEESEVKKSQIMNIIEFGKPVHAEMSAILDAAYRGISLKNTILYVTTFPCHECARHIIGVGIKKVVYIEPYPKSLVLDLHGEEVEIEQLNHKNNNETKIEFVPFTGIAPRQYPILFKMLPRKDKKGNKITNTKNIMYPRVAEVSWSYVKKEERAISELNNIDKKEFELKEK